MPILVSCPHCSCAVKAVESMCPHCGGVLRNADGSITRTAIAVLLGLSGIAMTGCESAPKPGAPVTGDNPPATTSASTEPTSVPTAPTSNSADIDHMSAPEYGVPATNEPPAPAPKYGVPATSDPSHNRPAPEYGVPRTR